MIAAVTEQTSRKPWPVWLMDLVLDGFKLLYISPADVC
jgi:hypothetical protein